MKNSQPGAGTRRNSDIFSDILDDRGESGLDVRQMLGDFRQPLFQFVNTGVQSFAVHTGRRVGWPRAAQHRLDVLRMPAQRDRERLQRPSASPPLSGVM